MNDTTWWIALGVTALVAIYLVIQLTAAVFIGATTLFGWAARQGFMGLLAFFTAWVFLLPLMLVFAAITGIIESRSMAAKMREEEQERERTRLRFTRKPIRFKPPDDAEERHKWANRLPPYDK